MTEIKDLGGRKGACAIKHGVSFIHLTSIYQTAWYWEYSSKLQTDPAVNNEPTLASAYVVI